VFSLLEGAQLAEVSSATFYVAPGVPVAESLGDKGSLAPHSPAVASIASPSDLPTQRRRATALCAASRLRVSRTRTLNSTPSGPLVLRSGSNAGSRSATQCTKCMSRKGAALDAWSRTRRNSFRDSARSPFWERVQARLYRVLESRHAYGSSTPEICADPHFKVDRMLSDDGSR
jgi:hypothetical protein